MPRAPLTLHYEDVEIDEAVKRVLMDDKDATLMNTQNMYFYVDPGAPSINTGTHRGTEIVDASRIIWDDNFIDVIASDPVFNGMPVWDFSGTTNHHMYLPDLPPIQSWTRMFVISVRQATIDGVNDGTLGQRYLWVGYDSITNAFIQRFLLSGTGSFEGWVINPNALSQGGHNIDWNDFPEAALVADTPAIICITYDFDTNTSKLYKDDGETAISSHIHAGPLEVVNTIRPYIGSFGPGSNTASWDDKLAAHPVHKDDDDALRMSDVERIAAMADLRATYDITL